MAIVETAQRTTYFENEIKARVYKHALNRLGIESKLTLGHHAY